MEAETNTIPQPSSETPGHENGMLVEVDEMPKKKSQTIVLAIQHVLAMFVACITVPMIVFGQYSIVLGGESMNLASVMIAPTLFSAGIGTLFYLFVTKFKSPMFLASSFAYMGAMSSAIAIDYQSTGQVNLWILPIGMAMVCLVYCLVALLIKVFGVKWLNKLLPPVVVGPIIMVIGLSLAGSAINNLANTAVSPDNYNWICIICGIIAMVVTAVCAHYGKKTVSLIPFLIGMGAGYIAAVLFTLLGYYAGQNEYFKVVDFSPLVNLFSHIRVQSFIDYPKFLFLLGAQSESIAPLTGPAVAQAALIFIPVSLVTICEHIGDHKNMSGLLQRDLLEEPGLTRTLIGDGVATGLSGLFCGAANTTYGENVAVVGVTKIASTKVIAIATFIALGLGFLSPLMGITQTIPSCVTGGVSLILYGFIASSGVKMLIHDKVDTTKTKNIFVASVILISRIGALVFKITIGSFAAQVSSTAAAMILGIVMNLILRDKKDEQAA